MPKLNLFKYSTAVGSAGALALFLLSACESTPTTPTRSGFLSSYTQLQKVDNTTWRWIDPNNRLASYNKFILHPVKVQVDKYEGEKLSDETRKRVSDYLYNAVVQALSDRYPIVSSPSSDTGEIRVGITDATRTGLRLNLCVEGEILDSYSGVQVASVIGSRLGETRGGAWWDAPNAKEMMDNWAKRIRQTIDTAHGR